MKWTTVASRVAVVLGTVVCAAFVPRTLAQTITAQISGTVTDPSGAVIPNVNIVMKSAATRDVRSVQTNSVGEFIAAGLRTGTYEVDVRVKGFSEHIRAGIAVTAGADVREDFKLSAGDTVSITVETNSVDPSVETDESATVINRAEMVDLALNTRKCEQMVPLQPRVTYGGPDELTSGMVATSGADNDQNTYINGLRATQVSWLLDGLDMLSRCCRLLTPVDCSLEQLQRTEPNLAK